MTHRPVIYIAAALTALSLLLAAWNWYLEPGRAAAWATVVVGLPLAWACTGFAIRRVRHEAVRRQTRDALAGALAFTGLILAIPLGAKLGLALDVLGASDLPQRVSMLVVGAFFVLAGNALPKKLTPLSALQCDGAKTQVFQRFVGRLWVLLGGVFALSWLTLPVEVARPVTFLAIAGTALAVAVHVFRLRRMRTREV